MRNLLKLPQRVPVSESESRQLQEWSLKDPADLFLECCRSEAAEMATKLAEAVMEYKEPTGLMRELSELRDGINHITWMLERFNELKKGQIVLQKPTK